jgi:hypothetical protein
LPLQASPLLPRTTRILHFFFCWSLTILLPKGICSRCATSRRGYSLQAVSPSRSLPPGIHRDAQRRQGLSQAWHRYIPLLSCWLVLIISTMTASTLVRHSISVMQASGAQEVSHITRNPPLPHRPNPIPLSSCNPLLALEPGKKPLSLRFLFPARASIHPSMRPLTPAHPFLPLDHIISDLNLFSFLPQIALETEFDNVAALALYTSLGFVPEKRLHRFYLNGKDAFRLVLPLSGAKDAAASVLEATSLSSDKQQLSSSLLQLPSHGTSDDDDDEDTDSSDSASALRTGSKRPTLPRAEDEEDYGENTAKLVRLRRRVAALRTCRMITVWPSEEDEDHVSGR